MDATWWKDRRLALLLLLLVPVVLLALARLPAARKPLAYRPIVVGFYVDQPGDTHSLPSLEKFGRNLNVLSPLWYTMMPDGSLEVKVNRRALEVARGQGLKVLPLANMGKNDDAILRDARARDRVIEGLVTAVRENNYDGLTVDIQLFPEDGRTFAHDRDLLTDFMRRLRDRLKPVGKELYMAVVPRFGPSREIAAIYDYRALADIVDRVALMTYDYHQETGPPGQVAPFAWVEENIKEALNAGFRPGQILLGIATYGYDWPAGESGGFSRPSKEIQERAARLGVEVKWSDRYQEPYYLYTAPNGRTREVWFENRYTLRQKIELMKRYNLGGIAIWRLGFEEPGFWDVLRANFPGR